MVYRYESAEDAFLESPEPGADPSAPGVGAPPPAGPSPSRFPTPSLPRPTRAVHPSLPPAARPTVPVPSTPIPPAAPTTLSQVYAGTPPPRQPRTDRSGGGRAWRVLIGGAAVVALLALSGLAGAALLKDRQVVPEPVAPTPQPQAEQSAATSGHDLDSRDTDQVALTVKEVFPGRTLVVTDGRPAYRVLKTQASTSCAVAATDEVADLLVRLGCNQVVRATLRSPDGDYLLTAGLLNLTDLASAQRVRDRLRQLLDERQGRFRGMTAGDDTEAVATSAARVGWQVRGHYLAYCLVTRADGERVGTDDAKAREALTDLVQQYLSRGVLERRANGGITGQPTPRESTADQENSRGEN
ncbi:hypothetical protein MRQ36_09195 [Micromonospora sp. R77]|uniref:hypothetical protein n=1 Tax=Micromonospora sp. R77 TaxID=2925836 RepID=UPI001F61E32E|nr:hypothetical protein [Micromonospora sp. R77]MCI4062736.1 hypothetical protein [Micromonospora sp. R77]